MMCRPYLALGLYHKRWPTVVRYLANVWTLNIVFLFLNIDYIIHVEIRFFSLLTSASKNVESSGSGMPIPSLKRESHLVGWLATGNHAFSGSLTPGFSGLVHSGHPGCLLDVSSGSKVGVISMSAKQEALRLSDRGRSSIPLTSVGDLNRLLRTRHFLCGPIYVYTVRWFWNCDSKRGQMFSGFGYAGICTLEEPWFKQTLQ